MTFQMWEVNTTESWNFLDIHPVGHKVSQKRQGLTGKELKTQVSISVSRYDPAGPDLPGLQQSLNGSYDRNV